MNLRRPYNIPLSKKLKLAIQAFIEQIADELETSSTNEFNISFDEGDVYVSEYGEDDLKKAFKYLLKHKILNSNSYLKIYKPSKRISGEIFDIASVVLRPTELDYFVSVNTGLFLLFINWVQSDKEITSWEPPILHIEYSDKVRKIDLYKYGTFVKTLSKNNFESENDKVMCFLMKNSNTKISIGELINSCGDQDMKGEKYINKRIHNIVNALGFKDDLRKLFFDKTSKGYVLFHNPVTTSRIASLELETSFIDKLLNY